jgi:hypothetical protein
MLLCKWLVLEAQWHIPVVAMLLQESPDREGGNIVRLGFYHPARKMFLAHEPHGSRRLLRHHGTEAVGLQNREMD